MSDREELADAIMSTHRVERHPELRRANSLVEADGIITSDWLSAHDKAVAEKAWDEGVDAALDERFRYGGITNPYRNRTTGRRTK